MQHDRDWRIAVLLRMVTAFETAIGAGKDNLGHGPHLKRERAVS